MSDDIKQIAALIGHHQALEKRVTSLTEQFQSASAQLQQQSETLSRVIRELDSASGNMTDTVRKSVNAALTQIEKELKQAGLAQQKPATDALN
ncbi:mobilization protein MobX, partial [Escherichia coli]